MVILFQISRKKEITQGSQKLFQFSENKLRDTKRRVRSLFWKAQAILSDQEKPVGLGSGDVGGSRIQMDLTDLFPIQTEMHERGWDPQMS